LPEQVYACNEKQHVKYARDDYPAPQTVLSDKTVSLKKRFYSYYDFFEQAAECFMR
jgi:hypothetical protein